MKPRFLIAALAFLLGSPTLAQESTVPETHSQSCAGGYYEGTASSAQAGELKISLNVRCEKDQYSGELVTPVGTYLITAGQRRGAKKVLQFANGEDKGCVEADVATGQPAGKFVFGDDSGPFDMHRVSDAKEPGHDKPTLNLTAAQWREDLHYFAEEVPKQHANAFHYLSQEEFNQQIARADGEMEHANGDTAYVAIDRIANAIGDGHTFVKIPIWSCGCPRSFTPSPIRTRM